MAATTKKTYDWCTDDFGRSHKRVYYREAERELKHLDEMLAKDHADARDSVLKLMHLLLGKDRRIVLYLGAGCSMSVQAKTPEGYAEFHGKSWIALLEGLLNTTSDEKRREFLNSLSRRVEKDTKSTQTPELIELLKYIDKLQVAWYLSSLFPNRKLRNEEISKLVEPPTEAETSSPLHEQLLAFPFDDIVTTNYDSHIANFLQRAKKPFKEITSSADLSSFKAEGTHRLFYLHGKVGQPRMVFDRFDYAELLAERDGILDYVTYLLRDSHVIYVGFGLDDPTFNLMETRLQTLHGVYRPQSFAFMPVATELERAAWRNRNLDIIDYEDHDNLPRILECVNKILDFVGWAEPDRPKEAQDPKADRTGTYLASALICYQQGKFKESLLKCRAALASTLFWKREPLLGEARMILPFKEATRLCEIRLRMGRNHYKLYWSSPEDEPDLKVSEEGETVVIEPEHEDHLDALKENQDAAEIILRDQARRPRSKVTARDQVDMQNRALRALRNSLHILKARVLYQEGQFVKARQMYEGVVASGKLDIPTEPLGSKPSTNADPNAPQQKEDLEKMRDEALWRIKFAEGYFYAKCQISRIAYQTRERKTDGEGADRVQQAESLADVIDSIKKTHEYMKACETEIQTLPEWKHYLNSIDILHQIAEWTAGRHLVGVCKDVIPTRSERCVQTENQLSDGIERLRFRLPEKMAGESRQGAKNSPGKNHDKLNDRLIERCGTWELSKRWSALRYRYLCRGYALRWLVSLETGHTRRDDADLVDAYNAIQEALHVAAGPGMERERIVNLLEAARLNILAMFGERILGARAGITSSTSPLSFGAGLYYLDAAFREINAMRQKKREIGWLETIGHRIASYFVVVSGRGKIAKLDRVSDNPALHDFLDMTLERMRETVIKGYKLSAQKQKRRTLFDQRIEDYRQSFERIRREVGSNLGRNKQAAPASKRAAPQRHKSHPNL